MNMRGKERRLRAVALVLLILLAGYQVATGIMFYEQIRWPENQAGTGFSVDTPWPSVKRPGKAATAAGLREGDRLLAVQGKPFEGEASMFAAMETLFPGDRVVVTVAGPDGAPREVSWQLELASRNLGSLGRAFFMAMMTVGMPVLCLIVGFWTVFARPLDKQAWLLLGMVVCFSHSVVHPGFFPASLGPLAVLFHEMHSVLNASWCLFMALFAWEFPRLTSWQERRSGLRSVVLGILLVSITIVAASNAAEAWGNPSQWAGFINGLDKSKGLIQLIQMTAISCFFALLTAKRFALKDSDSLRRLRIILFGAAFALTPLFFLIIGSVLAGRTPDSLNEWLILPALLAMCLFPVTLAYVIVVHRAFGVALTLRQGLQYALASRGVRVLQVFLILGIMLTAVAMATQPGMNRPRILQVVAVGAMLVFFLQRAAEWLSAWVDRRFFREAYQAELVLASLSEDVRTMVETNRCSKPSPPASAKPCTSTGSSCSFAMATNSNLPMAPARPCPKPPAPRKYSAANEPRCASIWTTPTPGSTAKA